MSKKKNRPPSAQSLIDSLLDEKSKSDLFVLDLGAESKPDDKTSSIVIDLQEKIEERSGVRPRPSEKKKAPSNEDRTIQLEELKRANLDSATTDLEKASEVTAAGQIPEGSTTDDRTQAIYAAVHASSRTVSPKTAQSETYRPGKRVTPVILDANDDGDDDAIATIDRMMPTEIKTRANDGQDKNTKHKVASSNYAQAGGAFASAEATLKQSESLRVAQKRITELEQELERLRRENENLSTAGDTLRRRTDELLSKTEQLESQSREAEKIHEEEKKVFRGQLQQKDRDAMELRGRFEEMEGRLENNFKKIRVRERELEHRLEIIKMESATLIAGKDKMILELKRQIDQLNHENSYGKQKSAELFNQYKGKQDTIRRVVRALRIALTILEGDEDASPNSNKKND